MKKAAAVIMEWNDDAINRMYTKTHQKKRWRTFRFYRWKSKYYFEKKAGDISILPRSWKFEGRGPTEFKWDPRFLLKRWSQFKNTQWMTINSWCVVAAPSAGWAKRVFPELSEEAVEKLWDQIFKATRSDTEDPIKAWMNIWTQWTKHEFMNKHQFVKLHYTNSLGTDLTIELPKGHVG